LRRCARATSFADQTTAEAKAVQLEELEQRLAGSGSLGRVALRIIERLAPPRTTGDFGKDC
jgi:hypothetical protein